jgi:hypothetical protein
MPTCFSAWFSQWELVSTFKMWARVSVNLRFSHDWEPVVRTGSSFFLIYFLDNCKKQIHRIYIRFININKIFENEMHTSNILSNGLQPKHNQVDFKESFIKKTPCNHFLHMKGLPKRQKLSLPNLTGLALKTQLWVEPFILIQSSFWICCPLSKVLTFIFSVQNSKH